MDENEAQREASTTTLPKLTKRELDRLREIGVHAISNCGVCPITTRKLILLGLVAEVGGYVTKSGRVLWYGDAKLTDAGRAVLEASA